MDIESPEGLNETKRGAFAACEDSNRVWIHRREGLKGKHRWNGLLIPAATAMVLLGMCDSATADTFGVQIAAGVAGHHVHKLENASIKEPNPGINFSQLYLQCNFWASLLAG
jgi:hypothetical protein